MSLAIPLSLAALGGGLATAIAAHDFFEGETLVADLIRTARLARANLADLDRKAMARTRCDAIVTLTTIPSRIDLIGMTLKSLLDQTTPAGPHPSQHPPPFPSRGPPLQCSGLARGPGDGQDRPL